MLPNDKIGCHHTGFKQKCFKLVSDGLCNRWTQVLGINPNTGENINRWDCSDNWLPVLLIENSQQQRQTAAAVESFRNDSVKRDDRAQAERMAMVDGFMRLMRPDLAQTIGHSEKKALT